MASETVARMAGSLFRGVEPPLHGDNVPQHEAETPSDRAFCVARQHHGPLLCSGQRFGRSIEVPAASFLPMWYSIQEPLRIARQWRNGEIEMQDREDLKGPRSRGQNPDWRCFHSNSPAVSVWEGRDNPRTASRMRVYYGRSSEPIAIRRGFINHRHEHCRGRVCREQLRVLGDSGRVACCARSEPRLPPRLARVPRGR
jgi:hypothetical protein